MSDAGIKEFTRTAAAGSDHLILSYKGREGHGPLVRYRRSHSRDGRWSEGRGAPAGGGEVGGDEGV